MLERVLAYVRSVISGKTKGDPAIGKYLLETFSMSTDGLDRGSFTNSLQVNVHRIRRAPRLLSPKLLGHAYGLVSCQPHPCAGGSFVSSATCHCIIGHWHLYVYVHLDLCCCFLYCYVQVRKDEWTPTLRFPFLCVSRCLATSCRCSETGRSKRMLLSNCGDDSHCLVGLWACKTNLTYTT